jgi:hypothetical protein
MNMIGGKRLFSSTLTRGDPPGAKGMPYQRWALCSVLIIVAAVTVPAQEATAQTPLPVGVLIERVDALLNKLQSLEATFMGDANIAFGQATQQLTDLLNQLKALVKEDLKTPIFNLTGTAQALALQLQQALEAYPPLIDRQRECLFQDLDLFLAGINTVTDGLKRGVPLLKTGGPRLISFRFEDHLTNNVVPREGGRMTVNGFELWPDVPPKVEILDNSRQMILAQFTPEGASDTGNTISVVIPRKLVADHAGSCLQLHVQTFRRKKILWVFSSGEERTGDLYLPMCAPQEYQMQMRMVAWVNYAYSVKESLVLGPKHFGAGWDSCEHRYDIPPQTQSWAAEIPPGWRIINVVERAVDIRGKTGVGYSHTNDSVTVTGWLDTADCDWAWKFSRVNHDTHWYKDLAVEIAGSTAGTTNVCELTEPKPFTFPTTEVCTNLAVRADASNISYWVALYPVFNGQPQPKIGEEQRISVPEGARVATGLGTAERYRIRTTYTQQAGGTSQVCATIEPHKGQCGY